MRYHPLIATVAACMAASVAHGAIVQTPSSSQGTALAYATTSSTDLINAGQSSLASASVSASVSIFPGSGINDGNYSNTLAHNTYFRITDPHFPATATYTLDTSVNTIGYTITSIASFMGWTGSTSMTHANQTYLVEYSTVGSSAWAPLTSVIYTPFADVNGTNMESRVVVSEDSTGILATGVDAIRFTFYNPLDNVSDGASTSTGTVIREIDVIGSVTVAIPAPAAMPAGLGMLGMMALLRRRSGA